MTRDRRGPDPAEPADWLLAGGTGTSPGGVSPEGQTPVKAPRGTGAVKIQVESEDENEAGGPASGSRGAAEAGTPGVVLRAPPDRRVLLGGTAD
jgi:hypothetical protein